MIRHIVLIRFRPQLPERDIAAIDAAFRSLQARLDGFSSYSGGPDVNFEGLDRGYRHGFVLDFADQAARMRYHEDPEHQALGVGGAPGIAGAEDDVGRGALRLLKQVADHKSVFFRSAWASYDTARAGTVRLSPHPDRIADLRADYRKMAPMMFDEAPSSFDDILAKIAAIQETINA